MNLRRSQRLVLSVLREFPPGLTDEEIYALLEKLISPSGARTRRRELVDKGLVRDSGRRRTTRAGRKTIVWEVVDGLE